MSTLQLYHGDVIQFHYNRRLGSPSSIVMTVNGVTVLRAAPSDFMALRDWLGNELVAVHGFMGEPEDVRIAENLTGDQPGGEG